VQVFGLIMARGGSIRLPRKNLLDLGGMPMMTHTIMACRASRGLTSFCVSTEDAQIAETARACAARVQDRPMELAGDDTPNLEVWQYALNRYARDEGRLPDVFVNLNPTSPLRTAEDIDMAIDVFLRGGVDVVIGVTPLRHRMDKVHLLDPETGTADFCWPGRESEMCHPTTQSCPGYHLPNGSITVAAPETVMRSRDKAGFYLARGRRVVGHVMPPERSVNIDTRMDLLLARAILADRAGQGGQA